MSVPTATARTAAVAAAVAVVLLGPAPPVAATGGAEHGRLFLTVSGSQNTWIRGIQLNCPGGEGHHPHRTEACERLADAHGELDQVRGEERMCTREYDPVTATAEGDWGGHHVSWRHTFPNGCALVAAMGPVFLF
ncbi:SSI family serine proteinase inhibitor [Streptomyces gamaensis]|uniref:SSI family serine proteinase inhibitor n=1 Tax=Streptomyces gamaensis TaxID=1763542 RepID=A0ABW0Z3R0_9ACTN